MRNKIFTLAISLFVFAFAGNAQKTLMQADPDFKPGEHAPVTKETVLNYDGPISTALGASGGGVISGFAQFTSDMTFPVAGQSITKVAVYVNDLPDTTAATFILKIQEGGDTPGAELYSEDFISSITGGGWDTLELATPFFLNGNDVFVGIETIHGAGQFPLGVDGGPANPQGDWTSFDQGATWMHLGDFDYGNWNIRAIVEPTQAAGAPGQPTNVEATADAGGALSVDLSWTNPDTTVDSAALADLTQVDVYLNGDASPIYTNNSPTIGGDDSYTATVPSGGNNTFMIVGTNSAGEGMPYFISVNVGVDVEVTEVIAPRYNGIDEPITPHVVVSNIGLGAQTFDVTLTDGAGYSEVVSLTDLPSEADTTIAFPDWMVSAEGTYTLTAIASDPGADYNISNNEGSDVVEVMAGCAHTMELIDDYGDGWNGNTASIFVNGVPMWEDITVATGSSAMFTFYAETNDSISFEFYGNGDYIGEVAWTMLDGQGFELMSAAAGDISGAITQTAVANCDPKYEVTFSIMNESGDPINNAFVYVANDTIDTDPDGQAMIPLFQGDYDITVKKAGYEDVTDAVTVNQEPTTFEITMIAIEYEVTFTVQDVEANPLQGATVNVDGSDYTTDTSGMAVVNLINGGYAFTVTLDGYIEESGTVVVNNGPNSASITMEEVPVTYTVTFNVDMSDPIAQGTFVPGTDFVSVTGSMVDWTQPGDDTTLIMEDADQDGIYTVSMDLTDGDYEYKYYIGAGWTNPGTEDVREFSVAGENVTLDDVWGLVSINDAAQATFTAYPNPTSGMINVAADGQNQITVLNAIGKVVATQQINGQGTIDLTNHAAGIYFIRLQSDNNVATQRVVVE